MRKMILLGSAALLALASCKKNQEADQLIDTAATTEQPKPAEPAEAVPAVQNSTLTTLALSEPDFDFGKIKKGEQVSHTFEVTNTGNTPLIISKVVPTCGCTVPDFTKEPILPGKTGKITLKFDSSNFSGIVHKTAELYANVAKVPIELRFTADVQL